MVDPHSITNDFYRVTVFFNTIRRDGEDLLISFDSDPLGSVIVDDYFTSQYTNQGLEIDANDGFALDLSVNSNKIAELLAASGVDDIDMDGGSVDGTTPNYY
ncbi:hypothetical protein [Francisella frigiditurris]|uniref:Uncharacterized protein n=1 Tax=Francisella frigiditurris TaxID=1542390 RepID=A0A1J0KSB9_9GAMM|nr:hypothetical protein [Francisella frigiditurris]APC96633.1 hypothetical protein KX01_1199 [Francisella frigiditurris]